MLFGFHSTIFGYDNDREKLFVSATSAGLAMTRCVEGTCDMLALGISPMVSLCISMVSLWYVSI